MSVVAMEYGYTDEKNYLKKRRIDGMDTRST